VTGKGEGVDLLYFALPRLLVHFRDAPVDGFFMTRFIFFLYILGILGTGSGDNCRWLHGKSLAFVEKYTVSPSYAPVLSPTLLCYDLPFFWLASFCNTSEQKVSH
jgi:hypothetical protein